MFPRLTPTNSTTVRTYDNRVPRDRDDEDVPRTLALAIGLWSLGVAAGVHADIFVRMEVEAFTALSVLATAFAVAVVTVDRPVRAWLDSRGPGSALLALLGLGIAGVAAGMAFASGEAVTSGAFPWAPLWLFGMPMTAAAAVSAWLAALREGTCAVPAQAARTLLLGRR